jgi:hypothetical protein
LGAAGGISFCLLLGICGWAGLKSASTTPGVISGVVSGEDGSPIPGATVRVQGTENHAVSDASGAFTLSGLAAGKPVNISAWKHGHYCGLVQNAEAPVADLAVRLVAYQTKDNPDYEWVPPVTPEGKGSCAECHHPALIEMSLEDAHVKSAQNPRFLTMYHGTDMDGNRGALTRYGPGSAIWKNITVPLPPEPSDPYDGPGFVLDFPDTPGTCSACHLPGASLAGDIDPAEAKGADRFGVHCDFCHKVAEVRLEPEVGLPFPRRQGVHSMEIRRPFTADPDRPQLFFGTFDDDNVPAEDTNLSLLSESRYCAPCHYGIFWSTVIYDSYGEWLRSPYSDPNSGKAKTCQECHMVSPTIWKGNTLTNVAPGKGGIERNPGRIHSHLTTVGETLLRNALTLTASAKAVNGKIVVEVTLTNDKTGHHVPSDCPLRHLILVVDARDSKGTALRQSSGPILPYWCGVGDREKGRFADLPGKTYAKLLIEEWTNEVPTAAYWRHTKIAIDNRLAAFKSDTSSYSFVPSGSGEVEVTVTLYYRRAFIKLMDEKKWNVPDIVMARETISLQGER